MLPIIPFTLPSEAYCHAVTPSVKSSFAASYRDVYKRQIRYYIEYFDEAGKENETRILLELGSPEETAKAILADYGYDTELPKSNGKKAQENVKEFVSACINDPDVKNIAKKSGDNIVGFSKKVFSFVSKAFKWCLKTFLKFAAVFSVLFLAFFVFGTIAFVFAVGIASVLCAVAVSYTHLVSESEAE